MTASPAVREVPFFNYRGAFAAMESQLFDTMRDVVRRGAFIMQKDLVEFEQAVAKYLGVRHAIGVGNATDALVFAFRAAGLQPGDEVIFPSHEMVAGPAAVHFAGGVPVPVDIGADRLLDPNAIEPAITAKTKFIMPVQLNGRTCNMDAIHKVADRHGLKIIEDSAQALGSKFKGRFAGTFGLAGAFSFYPAKILGCLGDGGLAVTNDDSIAERMLLMTDRLSCFICSFATTIRSSITGDRWPHGTMIASAHSQMSSCPRHPMLTPITSMSFRTSRSKPIVAMNSRSS